MRVADTSVEGRTPGLVDPIKVVPAGKKDRSAALAALTTAFSGDPVTRWAFPDPGQYLAKFPEFAELFGGSSFAYGSAYVSGDLMAAALWLPPGVGPAEEQLVQLIQSAVPEERHESLFAILGEMDECHPHEPHWYLPLIGVDPNFQGRGYGSALLEAALGKCDSERSMAYLESTNERNNPLYERFGFEVVKTIQIGDAPPMWPMVRAAR